MEIIIYGAGEVGTKAAMKLKKNGYNVVCFLDKNASGIEQNTGIKIVKLCAIERNSFSKNAVVVIALADGMIHKYVAQTLSNYGFEYIVMLPMSLSMEKERKIRYTHFYNACLNGNVEKSLLIKYKEFVKPTFTDKLSIIYEDHKQDEYIVWARVEQVYTERIDLWRGDKSKVHTKNENQDINIAAFLPFLQLNQFLEGQIDDCPLNWNSYVPQLEGETRATETMNRERLIRVFENEYSTGIDFFVAGAPLAIWNNNRWNLHGGHHRTTFLVYKGMRFVPIRVSKTDYDRWVNFEELSKLIDYINENNIIDLKAPIPHPAFRFFMANREIYSKTVLDGVFSFFRQRQERMETAIDISDMEGYFARAIARTSDMNSSFVMDDDQEIALSNMINKLVFVNNVKCAKSIINHEVFDVGFAISLKIDSEERTDGIINKLNNHIRRYLFIEVEDTVNLEAVCSRYKFRIISTIHREVVFGKVCNTYVLERI